MGTLKPAISGENSMSLTLVNEYGRILVGVSQYFIMEGVLTFKPIYVSKIAHDSGNILLTPKDEVMVWFQRDAKTSTIFEGNRSNSIKLICHIQIPVL